MANKMHCDIKEGLDGIMSRLNRREDTDLLATHELSEDYQNELEDERREFQSRYQSITARVDAMERQRAELMSSMAQWLEEEPTHSFTDESSARDNGDVLLSGEELREQILNTKMGFEKLKQISYEKDRLHSQGKDTLHLQEESSKLQMKVISKFKRLYESQKMSKTRGMVGAHWKEASDEIVDLLHRIRSKGTSSIAAVEEELDKAVRAIQHQAEEMMRLEGRVKEKEDMVEKWSAENAKLTNENLLLSSEKEKGRDVIRRLKKALLEECRKKGTPTTEKDVEKIAEGKIVPQSQDQLGVRKIADKPDTQEDRLLCPMCQRGVEKDAVLRRDAAVAAESAPDDGGQVVKRDDLDATGVQTRKLATLENENEWLTARVENLEQTLIKKESQTMKKELQFSELLDAVKATSPQILHNLSLMDQDTLTTRKSLVSIPKEGREPPDGKTSSGPSHTAGSLAVPHKTETSSSGEHPPLDNRYEELTKQRDRLHKDLASVKSQLAKAQRELITLKYASVITTMKPRTGPGAGLGPVGGNTSDKAANQQQPGEEEKHAGPSLAKAATSQEVLSKSRATTTVRYDDEFQAYAELTRSDRDNRPSRKMSRPRRAGSGPCGCLSQGGMGTDGQLANTVQMEDYVTYDEGMQTDSQMDPLGQWSYVPSLKKRRKTDPLALSSSTDTPVDLGSVTQPPTEWTLFDPTGPSLLAAATDDKSPAKISHQMRSGQEPPQLDTEGMVGFVDRELNRIVQGIKGFITYLERLIEREVTDMITTNQDIRKQLSEATLDKLDRGGIEEMGSPSTEDSTRNRTVAAPIRRGCFELVKDSQPSKFATKNAYASLQSGSRRFFYSSPPLPSRDIRSKTLVESTAGWSTFGRQHITTTDEAALERSLTPFPRGTICARLQHQIKLIGEHAIDVLKGTTIFFKETVTHQMEEYSRLHCAFGLRQELKSLMASPSLPSDNQMTRRHSQEKESRSPPAVPLKLTRSTSHSSFLESRNVNYTRDKREVSFDFSRKTNDYLVATQSLSSIQSSHRYLPTLAVYKNQKPKNRHELRIPKATLPRCGHVTLQVKAAAVRESSTKVTGADAKRRCRPVAVPHHKLQSRQRELVARQGQRPGDNQEQDELGTTVWELKRHIFQLQADQLYRTIDSLSPVISDTDANPASKTLPSLENERRRIIIHAQDQLRVGEPIQLLDKYAAVLSDGPGLERS